MYNDKYEKWIDGLVQNVHMFATLTRYIFTLG